jgi:hypothetical protein
LELKVFGLSLLSTLLLLGLHPNNRQQHGRGGGNHVKASCGVICHFIAAKISLRAYFEGSDWPLSKALPRGAEFLCGCLEKTQVACQLLNYKTGKFLNMQVSILLNQSNLDERIREGMAMSAHKFMSLTILRIQV